MTTIPVWQPQRQFFKGVAMKDEQNSNAEPISDTSASAISRVSVPTDADTLSGADMVSSQAAGLEADPNEKTLAMTISYIGTDYHGFARQEGLPTVQGLLEEALAVVFRREVLTVGAGRTDKGVHAHGQVVSFQLTDNESNEHSLRQLRSSINALTPDSIQVRTIEHKTLGFSARFSAVEREYRYRLVISETPALFLAPYAWWLSDAHLDIYAMRQAARLLVGEHDFRSFCVASSGKGRNTVREIRSVHIFGMDHLGEPCLVIQIIGNSFLHSMVRVIVGSLVEVGSLRRSPEWLGEALAARERQAAGPTAPARGLTLWRVRY
jgi:tRNA pseudouridine38-40 synthase